MNSMTPSQWLDVAVLAVAFIAAISGWRSGALGSVLSFIGVLLGAIAGVLLAPHIVSHIAAPRAKLFTALFLILAFLSPAFAATNKLDKKQNDDKKLASEIDKLLSDPEAASG